MPRQIKTPQQRADEALGVAQRRVARIAAALDHQRSIVREYEAQLTDALARLEYAGQDPALPEDTRLEVAEHLAAIDPPRYAPEKDAPRREATHEEHARNERRFQVVDGPESSEEQAGD